MKNLYLFLILFFIIPFGFAQKIDGITATVNGEKIHISYYVSGLKYYQDITAVYVYVSKDGGENFIGPLKQVTGDINGNIRNGRHEIVWDVLKEMPFSDEELIFDIRLSITEKPRKKHFFISYVGNDVTPVGVRMGLLGKTAFYIEARASLLANTNPEYSFNGENIVDYDKPQYYQFTGKSGWQAYSAVVGVTQQLSWNFFMYAGAGFAVENYIMEINNYNYDNETQPTDNSWVKDTRYSNTGVEVDAGVILKFNHLLINGGATAINFKSFGWSLGVGVSF